MLKLATTSLLYFSKKPLTLATSFGFLSVMVAAVYGLYTLLGRILGFTNADSGWTSLVILIVFFSGVQLLTIGIMGSYIGTLFDEIKNRPEYVIEEKINF
jgi:dolichol-phosphate mannosyltransferase